MTRILIAALALSVVATAACDGSQDETLIRVKSTTIPRGEGGTATSQDESFSISFEPGMFTSDVQIKVTERPETPIPEAALGPTYEVEASGNTAIVFRAQIELAIPPGVGNAAQLKVAHGETVGLMWDELLDGTRDGDVFTTETRSLSWFGLIDEVQLQNPEPEPMPEPQPEGEPEGQPEVPNPTPNPTPTPDVSPGMCAPSCMAQSGAVCCTGCGCELNETQVRCNPDCPSTYEWDCELQCCFDYDAGQCAG